MKKIRIVSLVCLFSCLLPAATPVEAIQTGQDRSVHAADINVTVELEHVQLAFVVRDSQGNFVRDLSISDFVLFENDRIQIISALKQQEIPISAVVAVDTSWSIGSHLTNAVTAAVDFFQRLEQEAAAVVLFSEKPRVILDWGEEPVDLPGELASVRTNGKTALFDSVIWIAQSVFSERTGKKVIILITDGIDTTSQSTFKDMMDVTRHEGISLYTIIYTNGNIQEYRNQLRIQPRRPNRVSAEFHNLIVLQNQFLDQVMRFGGRTIFSERFDDLRGIYGEIIREMKSQYVLLYQSDSERPEVRNVRIQTQAIPAQIFIDVTHRD